MTLEELRKLAEAATPGPWFCGSWGGECYIAAHEANRLHPGPHECKYDPVRYEDNEPRHNIAAEGGVNVAGNYDYEEGGIINPKDASYIAAANPAVVLKLLEMIAELRKALLDT